MRSGILGAASVGQLRTSPPGSMMGRWFWCALFSWPVLFLPGFWYIELYANTPGRLAEPPSTWPASIPLVRTPGRAAVVMLAHPRCPCSRSSLRELSQLMADIDGRADALVLFVDPSGTDWEQSDLWDLARGIPGVQVRIDTDGEIAHSLGAYTSGQLVVYDPAGALVFSGGITSARGHEGDNLGRSVVTAIVNHEPNVTSTTHVFGCELQGLPGSAP